jgi:DNA-binding MarR family transcriptional regulator
MAADPSEAGPVPTAFAVFTEVAIIGQLASAILQARLPTGMVVPQFAVLNHLAKRPEGSTPLQLARAFQVPKTSMSHSLAVLEARGYVETAPNPDDARSKIVRITPSGLSFRAGVVAALEPDVEEALAGLEPDLLERLLPLLRDLRVVLDRARDG